MFEFQNKIGRPIVVQDIKDHGDELGFSMAVIKRIWGSLSSAKKELGLLETNTSRPRPFYEYKEKLDSVLLYYKEVMHRPFISWLDIENNPLGINLEHKTVTKAFKREGLDVFKYILSLGLNVKPSKFSNRELMPDGEYITSTFEYDLSFYLKEKLKLIYNIDYHRDVRYKEFIDGYNAKSKLNCDYEIHLNDKVYYIEVAGIIDNVYGDWESVDYSTQKRQLVYREKLLLKKKLLTDNNKQFLFLFPCNFRDGSYKQIVCDFLELYKEEIVPA